MLHVSIIPVGGSCGVVCTGCDPVGCWAALLSISMFKQNPDFRALVKQKVHLHLHQLSLMCNIKTQN